MTATGIEPGSRTVVGNISLSLDGRVAGPGGEHDMSSIAPHALTDGARDHMVKVTSTATTVLLGRKNYLGFASFWPAPASSAACWRPARWTGSASPCALSCPAAVPACSATGRRARPGPWPA